MSNKVWIIDTCVLCELLPVPHKSNNDNRTQVLADFKKRIKNKDQFLLPYTVVIETGNHIGQAPGNRFALATKFTALVNQTINGEA